MSKVLVLPDLHAPYCDISLLKQIAKYNKIYKADIVMQLGDMFDFYHLSSYVKSTKAGDGFSELLRAAKQIKEIAKLFPKMKVLCGNHERRLARKAADAGIDSSLIRDIFEVVDAPKAWQYIDNPDHIEIDGVLYTHGFLSNPKQHAEYFNAPVVLGHLHSHMGINYLARKDSLIFSMCPGIIADLDALVFQYGPLKKYNKMCLGFGTVTDGIPQIFPLMKRQVYNTNRHNLQTKGIKTIGY